MQEENCVFQTFSATIDIPSITIRHGRNSLSRYGRNSLVLSLLGRFLPVLIGELRSLDTRDWCALTYLCSATSDMEVWWKNNDGNGGEECPCVVFVRAKNWFGGISPWERHTWLEFGGMKGERYYTASCLGTRNCCRRSCGELRLESLKSKFGSRSRLTGHIHYEVESGVSCNYFSSVFVTLFFQYPSLVNLFHGICNYMLYSWQNVFSASLRKPFL